MSSANKKYEPTEKTGMYRDTDSGAIVNRNNEALRAYRLKKQQTRMIEDHHDKIQRMEKSLESLEDSLTDIKEILLNGIKND